MTTMSLKKIMQRVKKEKSDRGTNVLGESRPIGSLQRNLMSTRAFRAHSRQQNLDEAAAAEAPPEDMDEKGKPLTKQQSTKRKRSAIRRKGKKPDRARSMAAKKSHKKRTAGQYAQAARQGQKTRKRNESLTEDVQADLGSVMVYHEMLADMDESERNEYFAHISEVGLDSYVEYLNDCTVVDEKCAEEHGEDDEDDEDMDEKKSKKESADPEPPAAEEPAAEEPAAEEPAAEEPAADSAADSAAEPVEETAALDEAEATKNPAAIKKMFAIASKLSGDEKSGYHDYLDKLHGKKASPSGPGAEKAKKDWERLKKESIDPIGEMLTGSDEKDQTEEGPLDPLGKDKKAKDLDSGDQVVGKDPGTGSKVKNPKGDTPEYKDANHSPGHGQDRGQISGYGY
jgi:hypothetical protein